MGSPKCCSDNVEWTQIASKIALNFCISKQKSPLILKVLRYSVGRDSVSGKKLEKIKIAFHSQKVFLFLGLIAHYTVTSYLKVI